jgi:uncharacterized protein (TIGR01777 family)
MRVIITGGTGLIGRALANSMAQDQHEVIVVSRNPKKREGLAANVRVEEWDARSAQGWGIWADGADAIVNLAGESIAGERFPPSRWTSARKKRILESRVNAGEAVVEAIKAAARKPSVVIQSSAVGYYGPRGDENITEEHSAGDDFLAGVCQQWEASTAEVEELGVRRVIIRSGLVLSSKGGVLPMMALPFKMFVGGKIGSGQQQIPWIHVEDEVAAIRFLIENTAASGAYNLATPNPLSNAGFSKALGRALRRPSFFPTPGILMKIAFGELASTLLTGQRAVPKRLQGMSFQFHFPELEGAIRDLYHNRV